MNIFYSLKKNLTFSKFYNLFQKIKKIFQKNPILLFLFIVSSGGIITFLQIKKNKNNPRNIQNIQNNHWYPIEYSDSSTNNSINSSPKYYQFKNIKGLKICCSTKGILFSNDSSWKIIDEGVAGMLKLLPQNDIYLITQVENDQEEIIVKKLLEESGLLWAGLNPDKILFCSTSEGRIHMIRQLEVQLHIDDNYSVISTLKPFVPQLVYISSNEENKQEQNISTTKNLSQFLTIISNQ